MKIGIVTFWDSKDNYGAVLQCYALQRFLIKNGHSPVLIKFERPKAIYTKQNPLMRFIKYVANFRAYFNYAMQLMSRRAYDRSNRNSERDFDGFRARYISSTDKIYTQYELAENPPQFDAYICGSDQIWGGTKEYYLSFLPADVVKIAYAPSFGGTNPFMTPDADNIKRYLGEFKALSSREKAGVNILHSAGFPNACQVVDPTLLLTRDDYASLFDDINSHYADEPKEAFLYFLGNSMVCPVRKIINFVKKNGMTYRYVASQGRNDNYPKSYLTIPEWIRSIQQSKIVITNSFHCVVFALHFHKPFMFIPLNRGYERMNDRIDDLLSECALTDRIYRGDLSIVLNPVDFTGFEHYRDSRATLSSEYLLNALSF